MLFFESFEFYRFCKSMLCSLVNRYLGFVCRSAVGFLDRTISRAMGCFFGCFRIRDGHHRHHHHGNRFRSNLYSESLPSKPPVCSGDLTFSLEFINKKFFWFFFHVIFLVLCFYFLSNRLGFALLGNSFFKKINCVFALISWW